MTMRLVELFGRILIAHLFIRAGIAKFADPAPFLAHMASHGVPGGLLPLVGLLEFTAGVAILLGLWIRPAALALGAFCVSTAFLFHLSPEHAERSLFLKDLAIAGGLFVLGGSKPAIAPINMTMLWLR